MTIYFITGNGNKFLEAQAIIPKLEKLEINLPEIQEIDPHIIIQEKLKEALKHKTGKFIVEDTSLYLDCLNGLPGPLIKWFLKTIGIQGIYKLVEKLDNNKAEAKTMIGYADEKGEIKFFEGTIKGTIVPPSGETSFGWDPIFKPEGYDKTFQEMNKSEKNKISMRRLALEKLKKFLD